MEALNIDDKCHVHWREGTLLLEAVVVERRPVGAKRRKKKQKTVAASSSSTTAGAANQEAAAAAQHDSPTVEATAAKSSLNKEAEPSPQEQEINNNTVKPPEDAPVAATATVAVGSAGGESLEQQQQQLAKENDVANANTDDEPAAVVVIAAEDMEYYVHYVGHDRRLDEWLTLDSFELSTLQRAEPKVEKEAQQQQDQTTAAISLESGDMEIAEVTAADGEAALSESASDLRIQRRRSSASGCNPTDNENNDTAAPFSITGGNWHGGRSGGASGTGAGGGSGGAGGSSADPVLSAFEREHEETTKVKNIEKIVMGEWEVEAWYYSPFPDPYSGLETLYVCEYCLTYMRKIRTLREHRKCCTHRHPPGREIYREDDLAVYELDGKDHRAYCQKLCLLAKLFLDHKTLYYDVNPFFFYVVCKVDEKGAHIAGYFSKEKVSAEGYNLACILTFPQFQKSGYGKFIISLSYELTKLEGKTGSPEKPLSDLGKLSYRSYWTYVLMSLLQNHDASHHGKDISIGSMSRETGIKTDDLISTLQSLDMLKVWKGQHVVYVEQAKIREYMDQKKKFRLCNPAYLSWTPPSKGSESAIDDKNT